MESLCPLGITPLALDVTSDASAEEVVGHIMQEEGRIDVLVNNAGYGKLGPMETTSLEDAQRQLRRVIRGHAMPSVWVMLQCVSCIRYCQTDGLMPSSHSYSAHLVNSSKSLKLYNFSTIMKVLLINGSPRYKGNTNVALEEIAKQPMNFIR